MKLEKLKKVQLQRENTVFRVADWPVRYAAAIALAHTRNATQLLRPYGIEHRAWRLLAYLNDYGDQPIGQLADLATLDRTTVSKMLSSLLKDGFVEKAKQDGDRRRVVVQLTEAGEAKYQQTAPIVLSLMKSYFRDYSEEEFELLSEKLRIFSQRVKGFSPLEM